MNEDTLTAELETLTIRHFRPEAAVTDVDQLPLEADEATFDVSEGKPSSAADEHTLRMTAELHGRSEAIERLRFDFEQVRAKWLGVQAELQSREDTAGRLDNELQATRSKLERANALLAQREQTLDKLKARIEEQNAEYSNLQRLVEEIRAARSNLESGNEIATLRDQLVRYEGAVAGLKAAFSGLRDQHRQTETYADGLRQQLADLRADSQAAVSERGTLRIELENARSIVANLESQLHESQRTAEKAESAIASAREEHAQEIRLLRFELAEAQETLTQNAQVTEQMASDLTENRSHRIELERLLADQEQQHRENTAALEKQVGHLEESLVDYEHKLATKSNAIRALMDELSRQHIADGTVHVDDEDILAAAGIVSETAERPVAGDRVTRLLVGRIGDQELRFPLFKNRLTIGRTANNDIYLKAQFISRRHAVVATDGAVTRIIDCASKNGVYVNSARVTEHVLHSGDQVTIGSVEFRYEELARRENG